MLEDMAKLGDTLESQSSRENSSGQFSLQFDVSDFRPEDITIKNMGNVLTVTARHSENRGGGSVTREYFRLCLIPKEVDPERLECRLDHKGHLVLTAPHPRPVISTCEPAFG